MKTQKKNTFINEVNATLIQDAISHVNVSERANANFHVPCYFDFGHKSHDSTPFRWMVVDQVQQPPFQRQEQEEQ